MDHQTSPGQNKFRIRLLNEEDVISSSDLINRVAEEMHSKGHDTYIHGKTQEQIKEYISNPNNKIAGIFLLDENDNEKKLVAEMGCFGVDKNSPRDENGDYLPNFNANAVANEDIYYIGSVCVDKDFRGNRFFERMLHFLEERNEEDLLNGVGKTNSVAMVDINNFQSLCTFLNNGYSLVQKTRDPSDGGNIVYLIKDVLNEQVPDKKYNYSLSMDDENYEEKMKFLIKSGFVGAEFDRKTKQIRFSYGNDILNYFGCDVFNVEEINKARPILEKIREEDSGELVYV